MSQENVEIVRSIYDAFERRDTESSFEMYAADIEWDLSRGMVAPRAYHGHAGVRESFRDLLTVFARIDFTVQEITETGRHVLATVRERYIGRASGVDVDRRHYAVWTLRDGRVTRMCVYLERDEALEAVGVPE